MVFTGKANWGIDTFNRHEAAMSRLTGAWFFYINRHKGLLNGETDK